MDIFRLTVKRIQNLKKNNALQQKLNFMGGDAQFETLVQLIPTRRDQQAN